MWLTSVPILSTRSSTALDGSRYDYEKSQRSSHTANCAPRMAHSLTATGAVSWTASQGGAERLAHGAVPLSPTPAPNLRDSWRQSVGAEGFHRPAGRGYRARFGTA